MITRTFAKIIVAGTLFLGGCALKAQDKPAAESKQQIEQIVRQYILEHPDVLMESVRLYQQRQQTAQRELSKSTVGARQAELLHDAAAPVKGNDTADITIVEFFDYRCGYCKRVEPTVMKLLADNPRVRLVFKEFPILGPDSVVAAKASLAARLQGAYDSFHQELMSTNEPFTVEAMERIATKLRLDPIRLKKDMESPGILEAINHNQELGSAIGINATPSFVINSELVSGALDAASFQALIDKAGEAGKAKQPSGL